MSKVKLQRELNLTHRGRDRGNLTEGRRRRRTGAVVPAQLPSSRQFDMVGSVKHLHAELQILPFGDREQLDYREIFVSQPRSRGEYCGRSCQTCSDGIGECRGVEPAFRLLSAAAGSHRPAQFRRVAVGNEIRAAGIPRGGVTTPPPLWSVVMVLSCQLPTTWLTTPPWLRKLWPLPEWQRVENGSDEALRKVEIRGGLFRTS